MIYLAVFILLFTLLRLLVAAFNYFTRKWQDKPAVSRPRVSVLIPARNEENNIGTLLNDLLQQDYPDFEIWVYDDASEDATPDIAREASVKDARVKIIKGEALPGGWLGKNHACYQLSKKATGDYFLFLDADVRVGKLMVKEALAHMQRYDLKLLSVFPQQEMHSLAEKLVVPVMNWILVSLLPLRLTRLSPWSSLSAANGQCMLFDAQVYRYENFHSCLRNEKVEDIAIFRYMKGLNYRVETLLGTRQIRCRMYRSYGEAINGFSRSVFAFFGESRMLAFLFGLITTLGFVPVSLGLPVVFLVLYFTMVMLLRVFVSLASRQNVVQNILLAPLQQLTFLLLLLRAGVLQSQKATLWKGRNVDKFS